MKNDNQAGPSISRRKLLKAGTLAVLGTAALSPANAFASIGGEQMGLKHRTGGFMRIQFA